MITPNNPKRLIGEATCPDCGREVSTWRHLYEVHMRNKPAPLGMVPTRHEMCPASGMPVVTEETHKAAEEFERWKGYGD